MMHLFRSLRSDPLPTLLALAYVILAAAYSIANPIHEATDELRHYRYVRYLADYRRLPVQSGDAGNAQAHHPPLYYATAALLSFWARPADPLAEPPTNPQWSYRNWEVGTDNKNLYLHGPDEAWPYRDAALAAHLARWVTVLWGAGAVALTALTARLLAPDRPAVELAAGGLVAFNPMFLYLGGAVNNDVPAGLMGAALALVCVQVVQAGLTQRRAVLLGTLSGAAALVKFNLVAMLAVIGLALALAPLPADSAPGWRSRRGALLRAVGIIAGATAVIAGWWYVRNTILYGEPTGFFRLTEIWGFRDPVAGVQLAGRELVYAWTSLWARFGYGQIPVPASFYIASAALCGAGLVGLAIRAARGDFDAPRRRALAVLAAAMMINFAVLYAYITVSPAGAMGRFFFPGLPAFAVLVAAGLPGALPIRWQPAAAGAVCAGMVACALAALIGYLIPAYALPGHEAAPPDSLNIEVGDAARILAVRAEPETVRPGEPVSVTVTWEILRPTDRPYSVFIHLVNPDGAMVAQRDTYTGLGNYPSHWWRPGHIFTETYRIYLPGTAYSPDRFAVEIGLYDSDGTRLPVGEEGDDALVFGRVRIPDNPEADYPNQTFINWDGHFALVGYTIEPRVVRAGKRTTVKLYWQALDPPQDESYKVFLHITQGWDRQWAGNDGNPGEPDASTTDWIPGQVIVDRRRIQLPDNMPPGIYTLELGWFSDRSGERLNIVAEDGHIIDNWLALNTIRVVEP